jgi:hypothetical protein
MNVFANILAAMEAARLGDDHRLADDIRLDWIFGRICHLCGSYQGEPRRRVLAKIRDSADTTLYALCDVRDLGVSIPSTRIASIVNVDIQVVRACDACVPDQQLDDPKELGRLLKGILLREPVSQPSK